MKPGADLSPRVLLPAGFRVPAKVAADSRADLGDGPAAADQGRPPAAGAAEDRVYPLRFGQRRASVLPEARLVEVADSYTFVPEDQPAVLAELIMEFTAAPRRTG
jgi:hypothetical protein